jgi:GTP-binding protein Era
MIGEKIAITSSKPQTTLNRITGIYTDHAYDSGEGLQMVFLDTPGIHDPRSRLGENMMRSVRDAIDGTDALLVILDVTHITPNDLKIASEMKGKKVPAVLALNKIDLISKELVLEATARAAEAGYDEIVPVSAKTGSGVDDLISCLQKHLPAGPQYFPNDMITDQPERILCAEIIREKALRHLRDEVPHGIGVEIMKIETLSERLTEINATIYCERDAHKGIIIGKHGAMLQTIGTESRADIEKLLDTHVNRKLWVKIRPGWRDNPADLKNLGYES